MTEPESTTTPEPTINKSADTVPQYFEILIGDARAGLTAYIDTGLQRIFFHTEIGDAYAGQGLASRLIRAALEDTRAAGERIVPICPFVKAFVEKHHDFDDLLDPVTPQAKATVESALG
ncbi:GNAT family N-acetyltransferase [Nocardia sp. NBC_00511]|uniref:GNAT family N-acetyltransferase n=1 Tax=Nocardia sp. NBC_00511 TaxID=2903591 RepID=UPI0030E227AA